jgi:hypothetical protein
VAPAWENLRRIVAYRERTQYDPKWELFFWETAMQSGEDNNVALTNDAKDRNAILAVDLCTFQLREYKAMARLAEMLGKKTEAGEYQQKADKLGAAMLKHLWFAQDAMFFNVRRDTGKPVQRISGSNFVPLIEDILPRADACTMIRRREVTSASAKPFEYRRCTHPYSTGWTRSCPGGLPGSAGEPGGNSEIREGRHPLPRSRPAARRAAGLLLDSGLQMRYFSATDSLLNQTKYVKIGEHEQGR